MIVNQENNKKYLKDQVNNTIYVKGKMLGSGGFAKCYQAINQNDGKTYAAKVIPKKSINQKRQRYKLLVQIKLHKSLNHRHIVGFKTAFEDKENVYILLQYCRNYTLKQLVKRRKRLTQHQARVYVTQIVKALLYIHERAIIHRDLKLGNILINQDMDTKICDFGLSTKVKKQGDTKKTICGTPNYIAPQILQENGHSYQVDIWSVGVILYTLLFGKPPFQDNTVQQTYQNIKNNRFTFPSNCQVSNSAKDLISRILVIDPIKRLTLQQILQHDFMLIPPGLSMILSRATLAVPPLQQSPQPGNFNINLSVSEEISPSRAHLREEISNQYNKIKNKKNIKQNYIRQIFEYQEKYGYLLSNGIIGVYIQRTSQNIILEYGSQYYDIISNNQSILQKIVPNQIQYQPSLRMLMNFKAFFVTKYAYFRLDQMNKKAQTQDFSYLIKVSKTNQGQIVTMLNNSIVQVNFPDLTSIMVNRKDHSQVYLIDSKGKIIQLHNKIKYNQKIREKINRSGLLFQQMEMKNQSQDQSLNDQY